MVSRGGAPADRPGMGGFTLLEVLVAIAILGMTLSSLLASQYASLQAARYAQRLTAAASLAEYQLIEIEFKLRIDGWPTNDVEFEGNFADQGWPELSYECLVDFIEMPEYSQLAAVKQEMDRADDGGDFVIDAGDRAFGAMGMVWPIGKGAIENSIRRAWCTVRWSEGARIEELKVETFWTDVSKLDVLPTMGGATQGDGEGADPSGPSRGGPGTTPAGGRAPGGPAGPSLGGGR